MSGSPSDEEMEGPFAADRRRRRRRRAGDENEYEYDDDESDYSNSFQEDPPDGPLYRPPIIERVVHSQQRDSPLSPVDDSDDLSGDEPRITDSPPTHLQQPNSAIDNAPSNRANNTGAQAGRGNPSPGDNPPIRGRPRSRAVSGTWAIPPGLRGPSNLFGYSPATLGGRGRSQSSDLLPSSSAGPSSLSNPAASGATAPVNRGTGGSSDAFSNPQSNLSDTPISTSYTSQPRSGFLRNDPEEPSGSINPFGASSSLQRDPPAGHGRTLSPSAAADSPRTAPFENLPWGPLSRRTRSTSDRPSDRSGHPAPLPIIAGSPPAQLPASPGPPPASSEPTLPSLESPDLGDPNVAQQLFSHVHRAGVRLQHLTELMTQLTTNYQSDQAVLRPALEQFSRAARDQETFTRAILTGHEALQSWQRNVDRSLRRVVRNSENFDDAMQGLQNLYESLEQHVANVERFQLRLQVDAHNIVVSMQRFVTSWEVEQHITQAHQQAILSQVSWMEPVAISFQFLGWFFSLFMVWRWGAAGSDEPPHENPHNVPPPAAPGPPPGPPRGDNPSGAANGLMRNGMARLLAWFGFEVRRHGAEGGNNNGEGGRGQNNEGGAGGNGDRGSGAAGHDADRAGGGDGGNAGGDQGGQQAEVGPGQYGSPLRVDGIPYQPYRRPSHPDHQPITPLFSTAQFPSNSTEAVIQAVESTHARRRQRIREILISLLILFALMINIYWLFYPSPWVPTALFHRSTASHSSNANEGPHATNATMASTHGTWLDAPVVRALFHAQHEAQSISALTVSSAESVLACAKMVAHSRGAGATGKAQATAWSREDWRAKTARDAQGACRRAVTLGTEVAEKMSALAGRLEWVFGGEKWWGAVEDDGEGEERGTGVVVKDAVRTTSGGKERYETAMTTSLSTVTETAGWQWPRRRVPAWF